MNLVKNAAHASGVQSKIFIEISCKQNKAYLSVADQGTGIPFHLQNLVFEPEFTTKPSAGTGLGLSVVRHICEQRGGTVQLDSTPNRGTKITVEVPLLSNKKFLNQGGHHAT